MSLADFLFDAARNGDDIEIVVDQDSEANPYYTSQTIAASMGSVPSSSKTTFKWQLSWVYEANSGKVQFFVLKSGKRGPSIINKSHRHEVALSFGRYNDATKKQSLATWYHIKPKEMFEFHIWILDGEEKRHVQSLAGSRRVLRLARVINSVIEELRRVRGIQPYQVAMSSCEASYGGFPAINCTLLADAARSMSNEPFNTATNPFKHGLLLHCKSSANLSKLVRHSEEAKCKRKAAEMYGQFLPDVEFNQEQNQKLSALISKANKLVMENACCSICTTPALVIEAKVWTVYGTRVRAVVFDEAG
ncbi:hypothetical protein LTR96_010208 [Exophiala xenobiotica]|nr:hypothetical protein LTR72_002643 [Exophiala xenobiotica]KAK5264446.1 hypothetical protein LTR96_010208 [Exophiala xenobiotica]